MGSEILTAPALFFSPPPPFVFFRTHFRGKRRALTALIHIWEEAMPSNPFPQLQRRSPSMLFCSIGLVNNVVLSRRCIVDRTSKYLEKPLRHFSEFLFHFACKSKREKSLIRPTRPLHKKCPNVSWKGNLNSMTQQGWNKCVSPRYVRLSNVDETLDLLFNAFQNGGRATFFRNAVSDL